jgi:hypothetical protein
MKCKATVFYGYSKRVTRNFTSKPIGIVHYLLKQPSFVIEDFTKILEKQFVIDTVVEECGGEIGFHIKLESEPYFGGSSTVLDYGFKCNKCGCTIHESLPGFSSIDDLEEFINLLIKEKK